ncbi:3-dehydroquinate synthase [Alteribacillus sp. HJP-4]|uniref:3-dehydroquinate synthase n=1 Tax=Alteribacillus sp. HJP-4 TaxID=2775394 RepID=UPI0035CD1FC5
MGERILMEQLIVQTNAEAYPVYVGEGIRKDASQLLKDQLYMKSKAMIITDDQVGPLYAGELKEILSSVISVEIYTIPAGEESKSFLELEKLLTSFIKNGLDRQSVIIALGGGVIGDLAGFAAATYMRGISFIQIPTTLLAHDSSVGGKTGINHPLGKNLIGSFHQPEAVLYDTDTLQSLPDKEWRSGFAEMIKHAYIRDAEFLEWLQENVQSIDDIKSGIINKFLARSIKVKADIVKEDVREKGIRAFLNFGHTLGHALEAVSGYGKITHGEAVGAGMIFALKVSNQLGLSNWNIVKEKAWLDSIGFPTEAPKNFHAKDLIQAMKKDKKTTAGSIRFVLVTQPGVPRIETVEEDTLLSILQEDYKGGEKA